MKKRIITAIGSGSILLISLLAPAATYAGVNVTVNVPLPPPCDTRTAWFGCGTEYLCVLSTGCGRRYLLLSRLLVSPAPWVLV